MDADEVEIDGERKKSYSANRSVDFFDQISHAMEEWALPTPKAFRKLGSLVFQQLFVELGEIIADRRGEIDHEEVSIGPRQFNQVADDFECEPGQGMIADDRKHSRIRPNKKNFCHFWLLAMFCFRQNGQRLKRVLSWNALQDFSSLAKRVSIFSTR